MGIQLLVRTNCKKNMYKCLGERGAQLPREKVDEIQAACLSATGFVNFSQSIQGSQKSSPQVELFRQRQQRAKMATPGISQAVIKFIGFWFSSMSFSEIPISCCSSVRFLIGDFSLQSSLDIAETSSFRLARSFSWASSFTIIPSFSGYGWRKTITRIPLMRRKAPATRKQLFHSRSPILRISYPIRMNPIISPNWRFLY